MILIDPDTYGKYASSHLSSCDVKLTALKRQSYQHTDDQELLQHFYQDGNNEWLGILLERYTLLLYGVCMKYLKNEEDARDSVQQIFIKVLAELKKYPVTYFKSWLYMVAKNHCLMKLRSKGQFTRELNEAVLSAPEDQSIQEELVLKDKNLDLMAQALQLLNREQQLCITLFYLEKKTYQQVAEISGYSMMQVKSHIQNGKRNLRSHIQRLQEDHER